MAFTMKTWVYTYNVRATALSFVATSPACDKSSIYHIIRYNINDTWMGNKN